MTVPVDSRGATSTDGMSADDEASPREIVRVLRLITSSEYIRASGAFW